MVRDSVLKCISEVVVLDEKRNFEDIVFEALSDLAGALGLSTFIFAYSHQNTLSAPEHHAITNAPDWMEHYAAENLRSHDPIVKYLVNHNAPVIWDDLALREDYASKEQNEVMHQAAEFGLVHGVSMPCRAVDYLGVLTFASDNKDTFDACKDLILYGPLLSTHLMDQVGIDSQNTLEKSGKESSLLTPREVDCLFWASEGKTAWEIGQIFTISERTAVFHLANVVKKLDSSSRQHAISKAILMGILKPRF